MSIMMMVEQGNAFWQCYECGAVAMEFDDFAYGHDCEAE